MAAAQILVLDAGDSLLRDQTPAKSSQGQSSIETMNMMGYDAMALGEGDLRQLDLSAIRQRIEEAEFAVLSANARVEESGELIARPYVLLSMDGHQVAIVGLTGQADIPGLDIRDPVQSAHEIVEQIGTQADIVILLSHAGLSTNQAIAQEIAAIDLIVSGGGNIYTSVPQVIANGPAIVHADVPSPGHAGRRVGVGTWSFDTQGRLQAQSWKPLALGPEIADDPRMANWAQAHR